MLFKFTILLAGCCFLGGLLMAPPVLANQTQAGVNGECGQTRYLLGMPSWDRGLESCDNIDLDEIENKAGIIITNILAILMHLAGMVAVVFVIVGGFKYVLTNGDPQMSSEARSTVINALIGLVIVVMARVLVEVIYNYLS